MPKKSAQLIKIEEMLADAYVRRDAITKTFTNLKAALDSLNSEIAVLEKLLDSVKPPKKEA